MARPASVQPTEVELEILRVLWEHGPCPLGTIHQKNSERRDVAYSSTRRMVQVMRDKGLIASDESVRPNLYRAVHSCQKTRRGFARRLLDRVFDDAMSEYVAAAIDARQPSVEELEQIEKIIVEAKRKASRSRARRGG